MRSPCITSAILLKQFNVTIHLFMIRDRRLFIRFFFCFLLSIVNRKTIEIKKRICLNFTTLILAFLWKFYDKKLLFLVFAPCIWYLFNNLKEMTAAQFIASFRAFKWKWYKNNNNRQRFNVLVGYGCRLCLCARAHVLVLVHT